MAFKDILREKRKELCFTRRELAKKLGVCPSNVQFWEEGSIPKTKENIDAIKKF